MSTRIIIDANSIGKAAFQGLPFDPEAGERAVRAVLSLAGGQGIRYQADQMLFVFTEPAEASYAGFVSELLEAVKEAGIAAWKAKKEEVLHQLSHMIEAGEAEVILLSADETWQSLVTGETVQILMPKTSKEEGSRILTMDAEQLKEIFGFAADKMPEFLAMSHILGEGMAKRLMRTYGSLSSILLATEDLKSVSPRTSQLLLEKKGQILEEALVLTPEAGKVDSAVIPPLSPEGDVAVSPEKLAKLTEGAVSAGKQPGEGSLYVDSLQMVHEAAEQFEKLFEAQKGIVGLTFFAQEGQLEAVGVSAGEVTAVYDFAGRDLSRQLIRLLTEARENGWTLSLWDLKATLHMLGHLAGRDYDTLSRERFGEGMHQEANGQLSLFDLPAEEKVSDRGAGDLLDYLCSLEQQVFEEYKDAAKATDQGFLTGDYAKKLSQVYCDVSLLAYLADPLSTGKDFGIEKAAKAHLKLELKDYKTLFGKQTIREAVSAQTKEFVTYGGSRSALLVQLAVALQKILEDDGQYRLYQELELPLVFALYSMEKEGIAMDPGELSDYGQELSLGIEKLQAQIYEEAGEAFNINSPKQLGTILFEKLSLPAGKKTKSGYSTAADVLEKLAEDYPIVEHILSYRTLSKLKSTYADGLLGCVAADERVHTTFQQTVTATGRLSSTDPNLQNIPVRMELGKRIRRVFHAKEGCVFLDADYSQIELRVLAHLSGDQQLIEAYRQNRDIHQATAALVFHVPFEEVTPAQRRAAKAVNFGIVYGISSFGLGNNLDISRAQAQQYIDDYFKAYPGLHAYLDELVALAKRDHVALTMFGRRRPMPELSSGAYMQRQFGERVAMNAPIQGSAADIIKIAMLHVWQRLRWEERRSKLLLQVHDELLIETYEEEKEQVKKILDEEMHRAADLFVPLEIDMEEGRNWYDAH